MEIFVALTLCTAFNLWLTKDYKWYEPTKLFQLMWIIQMWIVLVFCQNILIFQSMDGLYYIMGAISCYSIGVALVPNVEYEPQEHVDVNEKSINVLVLILSALAFVSPLMSLIQNGFGLDMLLSMNDMIEMNNEMSVKRYDETLSTSMVMQLLLVFTYLAPLVGGFFYKYIKHWLSWSTILPGLLVALTQAMKMSLITGVMLWFAGYLTYVLFERVEIRINLKKILLIVVGVFVFLYVMFFSMFLRIGDNDRSAYEIAEERMTIYTFGHMPAFCAWYDNYMDAYNEPTYGARTVMGISNQIGLLKREMGIYQDMIRVTKADGYSNVFTVFRVLIEDFGIMGSCFWMALMGACIKLFQNGLKRYRSPYFAMTMLTVAYFFIMWSFVTSMLAYTSYILMYFLFYFIIRHYVNIGDEESVENFEITRNDSN